MPHFTRYIGIDYSGAETANSRCKPSLARSRTACALGRLQRCHLDIQDMNCFP